MYLVYKNKYGIIYDFVSLFYTKNEAIDYVRNNSSGDYTLKVIFVQVVKNEN